MLAGVNRRDEAFTVNLFRVNLPVPVEATGGVNPPLPAASGGINPPLRVPRKWLDDMRKAAPGPRDPMRDNSCIPQLAVSDCAFCAFFFHGLSAAPARGRG